MGGKPGRATVRLVPTGDTGRAKCMKWNEPAEIQPSPSEMDTTPTPRVAVSGSEMPQRPTL